MKHCDAEQLAGYALGDVDELSQEDEQHLAGCEQCRAEVQELKDVLAAFPVSAVDEMVMPRAEVWDRVLVELHEDVTVPASRRPEPDQDQGGESQVTSLTSARQRKRSHRWLLRSLAAAVVGVLIGVVGTVTVTETTQQAHVLARTALQPLPGKSGTGSAEMVKINDRPFLRITVAGLGAGAGYHELWLINTDGKKMVSLGVLTGGNTETFALPAGLSPSYRIVDISLEPENGNPQHSGDSLTRGTLPI